MLQQHFGFALCTKRLADTFLSVIGWFGNIWHVAFQLSWNDILFDPARAAPEWK